MADDPLQIAAVFTDDYRMTRLIDAIHRMDESLASLSEHFTGLERQVDSVLEKAEEGADRSKRQIEEVEDAVDDLSDIAERSISVFQKLGDTLRGAFDRMGVDDFGRALNSTMRIARGVQTDPTTQLIHGLSSLPWGIGSAGLIMLEAKRREYAFEAAGQQTRLGFMQTGGTGGLSGQALGGRMRRLREEFLASESEFAAPFQALVEGGSQAEDAVKRLTFSVEGFENTLAETSLGLDKTFQLAAGSSARFAAQFRQDTGATITDSLVLVRDLGRAVGQTGQNMQQFVGSILQVTSALRVQGSDARDLAHAYMSIQKTMEGTMKVPSQRVAQTTVGVMQGMGQFVANMSEGLRGAIGRRVAARMGVENADDLKPFTAARHMLTGFKFMGGQGNYQKIAMEEAYRFLREHVADPSTRAAILEREMGPEAAQFFEMQEKRGRGVGSTFWSKDFEEALKNWEDQRKKAEENEPLKKNAFDRQMERVQQLMNYLGEAGMQLMKTLITTVGGGFESLIRIATGESAGAVLSGYGKLMKKEWGALGSSLIDIAKAGGRVLGPEFKRLLSDITGVGQFEGSDLFLPPLQEKSFGEGAMDFLNSTTLLPFYRKQYEKFTGIDKRPERIPIRVRRKGQMPVTLGEQEEIVSDGESYWRLLHKTQMERINAKSLRIPRGTSPE